MTDLATLKAQISAFVGSDVAPVSLPAAAAFVDGLAALPCDLVHLTHQEQQTIRGKSDDLTDLAHKAAADANADASVFICAASSDPNHILFCGSVSQNIVILRTRAATAGQLLEMWRRTTGAG